MQIEIEVSGQRQDIKNIVYCAQQSKNCVECKFSFTTPEWQGLVKTAHFKADSAVDVYSVVLKDDKCVVPSKVLEEDGFFSFSVIGEKEDYRITTAAVSVFNRKSVYGGEPQEEPDETRYEQMVSLVAEAVSSAEDAKTLAAQLESDAESGKFMGEKGEKGDTGAQGPQGEKGEKGDPGDSIFTKINAGIETDPTVITEPGAYYVLTDGFVQVSFAGARSADISPNDPIAVVADTILLYGNVGSDSSMFITAINGNYTVYRNVAGKVQSYSFNDLVYYDPETGDPVTMQILCETLTTISELIFPAIQPPAETGQLVTVGECDEQSGIFKLVARNADSKLSYTSTFPVQNKVVKEAVDTLNGKILSAGAWKQLADITTTQEVSEVEITKDVNGNGFNVKDIIILIRAAGTATNVSARSFVLYTAEQTVAASPEYQKIFQPEGKSFSTVVRFKTLTDSAAYFTYNGMSKNTLRPNSSLGDTQGAGITYNTSGDSISYIKIAPDAAGYALGAGSIIQIWGC